ncbi:hypothetical protein QP150_10135 [Sphingomonas sp. 22L2VL55-3]
MIVGDVGRWARSFESIEVKLARTLEGVWPTCLSHLGRRTKVGDELEDPITRALVFELRRNKLFPGRVITQYEILEAGLSGVTAPSRIDFVVAIGDAEDVYLACECKRLNVSRSSGFTTGASAYVFDGLSRFAESRYSAGLPIGVMLGYVMDGRVGAAQTAVQAIIATAHDRLGMIEAHSDMPSPKWRRFRTRHRGSSAGVIEVRHTLLPLPSRNNAVFFAQQDSE